MWLQGLWWLAATSFGRTASPQVHEKVNITFGTIIATISISTITTMITSIAIATMITIIRIAMTSWNPST